MTVGSNIKFVRKYNKLTQQELADKISKNLSTIKNMKQIKLTYLIKC